MKNSIIFLVAMALATTSCQQENVTPEQAVSTPATSPIQAAEGTTIVIPTGVNENLVTAARNLTNALNAGNETESAKAFTENAIFDSVGRIYNGRNDIMGRFLTPEVIRARGRYTETRITGNATNPNIVRIEYDFRTGSYSEKFYYEYTIQNGLITNVLGRYI